MNQKSTGQFNKWLSLSFAVCLFTIPAFSQVRESGRWDGIMHDYVGSIDQTSPLRSVPLINTFAVENTFVRQGYDMLYVALESQGLSPDNFPAEPIERDRLIMNAMADIRTHELAQHAELIGSPHLDLAKLAEHNVVYSMVLNDEERKARMREVANLSGGKIKGEKEARQLLFTTAWSLEPGARDEVLHGLQADLADLRIREAGFREAARLSTPLIRPEVSNALTFNPAVAPDERGVVPSRTIQTSVFGIDLDPAMDLVLARYESAHQQTSDDVPSLLFIPDLEAHGNLVSTLAPVPMDYHTQDVNHLPPEQVAMMTSGAINRVLNAKLPLNARLRYLSLLSLDPTPNLYVVRTLAALVRLDADITLRASALKQLTDRAESIKDGPVKLLNDVLYSLLRAYEPGESAESRQQIRTVLEEIGDVSLAAPWLRQNFNRVLGGLETTFAPRVSQQRNYLPVRIYDPAFVARMSKLVREGAKILVFDINDVLEHHDDRTVPDKIHLNTDMLDFLRLSIDLGLTPVAMSQAEAWWLEEFFNLNPGIAPLFHYILPNATWAGISPGEQERHPTTATTLKGRPTGKDISVFRGWRIIDDNERVLPHIAGEAGFIHDLVPQWRPGLDPMRYRDVMGRIIHDYIDTAELPVLVRNLRTRGAHRDVAAFEALFKQIGRELPRPPYSSRDEAIEELKLPQPRYGRNKATFDPDSGLLFVEAGFTPDGSYDYPSHTYFGLPDGEPTFSGSKSIMFELLPLPSGEGFALQYAEAGMMRRYIVFANNQLPNEPLLKAALEKVFQAVIRRIGPE